MSAIGHNNPPPFVAHDANIGDLYDEAKHFLDGAAIENQGQAEAVANLLDRTRKAWKAADEQRKTEKRPHDDAAQAVQDQWSPLLAKAKRLEGVAKTVIGAWQQHLEAEQRAEAARLAQEAQAAQQAAREAAQTRTARLEDAEQAEAAIKAADALAKAAARADKAKPLVASGGRAITLRSYWEPELTDALAALKHYMARQPDELKAWLIDQARKDIRGGARDIPGFTIREDRRAA